MANNTVVYVSAGAAFVIISIFFLIAFIQNSVDESRLLATPTIPAQNAVLTSFASTKIYATADEVFNVLLNYKDYHKWSSASEYKWKDVTADGVPLTGSTGIFKLAVEGFITLILHVKLTLLDRQRRMIAERTNKYPKWLLASERVQEVVPVEGKKNVCEYRTWHTLEGVAAYFLLLTAKDDLDESQKRSAEDLKVFVETGMPNEK